MPFFRHMNTYLQASYVELLASENARAALITPDDTSDHPWLKGILLEMIVPGRPYRKKNQLSTDEVVMASIATLFTMRSFGKTIPFVVLYEIDDVIVSERMRKLLVEFLVKRSMDRQVIMVSNSEQVYAKADSLIGVLVVVSKYLRNFNTILLLGNCEFFRIISNLQLQLCRRLTEFRQIKHMDCFVNLNYIV